MLKAGFTSVGEFHYLHHAVDGQKYDNPAEMSERILAASDATGIGLTHLPVLYRYGDFGAKEPSLQQCRFLHQPEDFLRLLERLLPFFEQHTVRRLGMAPHSLRAVSPELLDEVLPTFHQFCPEGPLHLHTAEQTAEVEDCLEWCGKRPVQWLFENHEPDARWCLIHATHLDERERELLAGSEAVAGLCPTTEANLGDGLFPMQEFLSEGGSFGIGSDSHISVSVSEELRWLEYQQRLLQRQRNLLCGDSGMSTGRYLFEKALAGGSQALGLGTGQLKEGSRADWLVLDYEHPLLEGRKGDALLDGWIFSGNAPLVRDVFVGGKQVIHGGRHLEEETIKNTYRKTLKRILS
jgi:formimidoylglutamate deiminase